LSSDLPKDWYIVKLGEVCTLNYGKSLVASKRENGIIPVYSSAGITGYHNKSLVDDIGIIIGRKGTVGSVYFSNKPFYCIDTAYYILPSPNYDLKYLFYRLKSLHLDQLNEDSAVPGLNRETAYSQRFLFPPIGIQKKIASILSALDDKIELNNKINENLEQQAQAIFKNWFVDFEPFKDGKFVDSELGEIPEGWKVGSIGDYSKVRSGFAFKSSWWESSGIKVIKIKNISSSKLELSDCSYVGEDKSSISEDFVAKLGDLLIAMTGATLGQFSFVPECNEKLLINQRVGKFLLGSEPLKKLPFLHNLLLMSSVKEKIVRRGQGSAQPNISPNDIESVDIILPPSDIIDNFNSLLFSHYLTISKKNHENECLSTLRDSLLSKLMSGEIDVSMFSLSKEEDDGRN
jgi:Restriction endonuclease S subunits